MKIVRCKILVLAVILLAVCGKAFADVEINETNFPDAAFRKYINKNYGYSKLTDSTIASAKKLDLSKGYYDDYIKSLKGIEYFTALEELNCSGNQLVELDLSSNVKLFTLDCNNNSLTSLNVSKNTLLRKLYADSNHLTALDLSNNTHLQELDVSSNQLTTLDLSKNTALERLECEKNQLTALDLSNNTELKTLYCNGNGFNSLNLSKHTQLESLNCDFTIDSTNDSYTFNLSSFMTAYGMTFDVPAGAEVTANFDNSYADKSSYLSQTSSGEYTVSLSKSFSYSLKYIYFSLRANGHTADTFVRVYSYSPSSSSPSTPLPTRTDIAPTITTTELDPATVGKEYSCQLISSAVATWTIKGKLPAGLSMSSSGLITGTPTKDGSSKITFIATNDLGEDKKSLTLTVYELPAITTESLKDATVGKKYKETIKGKGSKPLTWEFDADLPDGLMLDTSKHKISGTPTINELGKVKVTLSNPAGSVTKTFWLFADAILPEIKTKKLKDGTWGKPYKAVIKTKGTEPITLSMKGYLPKGLTFDADTGEISGTPTEAIYDEPIRIIAENMGGSEDKTYSLTIKAVPPKFTTKKLPDAVKGEKYYSPSIEYTGGPDVEIWADDDHDLVFEDCGLYFSDGYWDNPMFEGTPTKAGKFKFTLVAENLAKTVKKTFTINVLSAPEFREGSSTLKSGIVGKSYKYKFSADGTKKITFSISSGSLPSGVSLSTKGKLSGKPTSAGVYNFTVKAANSIGEAEMDFSITITNKDGSITSDETSSAAPSDKSAVEEALPADSETSQTQEAYPDSESESVTAEGEGYEIVAVLPEVSVDVSGMYDLSVELDEKAHAGEKLLWLANSGEPASDDNIAEFSDEDGLEIDSVPENRKVNVSVWLNAGRIYKPAIAVQRIH